MVLGCMRLAGCLRMKVGLGCLRRDEAEFDHESTIQSATNMGACRLNSENIPNKPMSLIDCLVKPTYLFGFRNQFETPYMLNERHMYGVTNFFLLQPHCIQLCLYTQCNRPALFPTVQSHQRSNNQSNVLTRCENVQS